MTFSRAAVTFLRAACIFSRAAVRFFCGAAKIQELEISLQAERAFGGSMVYRKQSRGLLTAKGVVCLR